MNLTQFVTNFCSCIHLNQHFRLFLLTSYSNCERFSPTSKVRSATILSLASLAENRNVTSQSIEHVITQLRNMMTWSCENDVAYDGDDEGGMNMLGLHEVKLQVIEISIRMGASIHPRFRDDC